MLEQDFRLPGRFGRRQQLLGQLFFQTVPRGRGNRFIMIVEPVSQDRMAGKGQEGTDFLQVPGQGRQDPASHISPGFHHLPGQVVPFTQEMEEIALPQVAGKSQLFRLFQQSLSGPGQILLPFRMLLGPAQVFDHRIPMEGPEHRQGGKDLEICCRFRKGLFHGCPPSVSGASAAGSWGSSRLSLTVWGPLPSAICPVVAISKMV